MNNVADLTILAGAVGVALLGAIWMFLRNKRRKDLDSFERGILTSGGLRANTVFGNTTGNASTSDTSFLTDFAQSADGNMIDTNDVDPIAEAEVYMAYGRDAQAEEILKDAISKEPKRYELHLKLLEMYALRKDTSAFEAIAGELYTTLGADDPTWAKVALMGAEMEPENPLYDVSKAVATVAATTQAFDASDTQKLAAADFTNVDLATDYDLDFPLDADDGNSINKDDEANAAVMQSFSASESADQNTSFDMGSLDVGSDDTSMTTDIELNATPTTKQADNSMDFDLGDFGMSDETAPKINAQYAENHEVTMYNLPALDTPPSPDNSGSDLSDFNMEFNLPSADEPVKLAPVISAEDDASSIEDISFDFGMHTQIDETPTVSEKDMPISEMSFDIPEFDLADTEDSIDSSVATPDANQFDLSTISLDLTDATEETSTPELSDDEPEDVAIKLDLVSAYIDMDDKEGAKELLEEVMKEGGVKQQLLAKELLASLA